MLQFNDTITSIRVPAGLKITLWQHPNYAGRRLIITGPKNIANLGVRAYRFSDITSSFTIGEYASIMHMTATQRWFQPNA
jgi:hypothetical protein